MTPMLHKIYDASLRLGISEYALRRLVRNGEVPVAKISGCHYIPDDELRLLVARKVKETAAARKAAVLEH